MIQLRVDSETFGMMSSLEKFDVICDAFEADWRNGKAKPLSEYVSLVEPNMARELARELALLQRDCEESYATSGDSEGDTAQGSGWHCLITDRERLALRHERFENYTLVEEVGRGSSGIVFRAEDIDLGSAIAIKVPLLNQSAGRHEYHMFLREAQMAAKLKHDGIVRVIRVGEWQDTPFIASDYIDGKNLKDWLRDSAHKPSAVQIARLVADIADAVHHAHNNKIIHRDLKPSNIMIEEVVETNHAGAETTRLKPYVLDFGISKALNASGYITLRGEMLGTPTYMSPEQANGNASSADHRSDVYSLGVILYELLAGVPPFTGNVVQILERIRSGQIEALTTRRPQIPSTLANICHKCLQLAPDERYQSASELARDLRMWLNGVPVMITVAPRQSVAPGPRLRIVSRAVNIGLVVCLGLICLWQSRLFENGDNSLPFPGDSQSNEPIGINAIQKEAVAKLDKPDLLEGFIVCHPAKMPLFLEAMRKDSQYWLARLKSLLSPAKYGNFLTHEDRTAEEHIHRGARIIAGMYALGDSTEFFNTMRTGPDPRPKFYTTYYLKETQSSVLPLVTRLQNEHDPSILYNLLLALGLTIDRNREYAEAVDRWVKNAYLTHPSAGVHSICRWYLTRRQQDCDFLKTADAEFSLAGIVPGREWHVSPSGILFIHCLPPTDLTIGRSAKNSGVMGIPTRRGNAAKRYAMSAFEIPEDAFHAFSNDSHSYVQVSSTTPAATNVSLIEALNYCAWLDGKEGIPHNQRSFSVEEDGRYHINLKRTGYRLPTEGEWEFACKAGTTTARYTGSNDTRIEFMKIGKGLLCDYLNNIPNEFGMFNSFVKPFELTCSHYTLKMQPNTFSFYLKPSNYVVTCGLAVSGQFSAFYLRSVSRFEERNTSVGFRICRTLEGL